MLVLHVHDALDELPAWLEPYLSHLELIRTPVLPGLAGSLTLDREGLAWCWMDQQRFRLGALTPGRNDGVRRALGKPRDLTVLDACAGFGEDTLFLRTTNSLTVAEHNPLTVLFLAERLHILNTGIAAQVELHYGDAMGLLATAQPGRWDVIYLDPMFPARNKKALPKQQMQVLAQLQEAVRQSSPPASELDATELLHAARRIAGVRVVLKRRLKDAVIARPDFQHKGSKVRFDIYSPD